MELENLFKSLVWDNLVKAAIKKIFVAAPFLAWGPLGIVAKYVIGKIADKLYEALKEAIDMQRIAFRNKDLRKGYERASVTLRIIAQDRGIDSDEFKKAREEHKKNLAAFVRFST